MSSSSPIHLNPLLYSPFHLKYVSIVSRSRFSGDQGMMVTPPPKYECHRFSLPSSPPPQHTAHNIQPTASHRYHCCSSAIVRTGISTFNNQRPVHHKGVMRGNRNGGQNSCVVLIYCPWHVQHNSAVAVLYCLPPRGRTAFERRLKIQSSSYSLWVISHREQKKRLIMTSDRVGVYQHGAYYAHTSCIL